MRGETRPRRTVVIAVLAAAALGIVPSSTPAAASWQASTTAPAFALSTGLLVAPVTRCDSISSPRAARISWPQVEGATAYRVVLGNTQNANTAVLAENHPGLSFDVTGTLLLTLVSSVLGSLLLGGSVYVEVRAKNNAWVSPASNRQNVVLAGSLRQALSGGLKCQGT
ncbi:hypothetical protein ACIPVB_13125 [Microbacterium sp. NPDC090007]|uniref:hypothetical protein n=1 Tax=Microbacterium sp. NPDC090007 TaxID=3364204 RepID=UPI0038134CB7